MRGRRESWSQKTLLEAVGVAAVVEEAAEVGEVGGVDAHPHGVLAVAVHVHQPRHHLVVVPDPRLSASSSEMYSPMYLGRRRRRGRRSARRGGGAAGRAGGATHSQTKAPRDEVGRADAPPLHVFLDAAAAAEDLEAEGGAALHQPVLALHAAARRERALVHRLDRVRRVDEAAVLVVREAFGRPGASPCAMNGQGAGSRREPPINSRRPSLTTQCGVRERVVVVLGVDAVEDGDGEALVAARVVDRKQPLVRLRAARSALRSVLRRLPRAADDEDVGEREEGVDELVVLRQQGRELGRRAGLGVGGGIVVVEDGAEGLRSASAAASCG